MEMTYIVRFHVREGNEKIAESALRDVVGPTRGEEGCISINALRSRRDTRLFLIHSRWKDEAAFDAHANQPHTRRFVAIMEPLIDHPWDGTRAEIIA